MASTNFTTGTLIEAPWMNDVDEVVYGVQSFGAVGDGVTDDTSAIQAALNSGKSIFVPGTDNYYKISSELVMQDKQRIFGEGRRSQIRQTTSNLSVITAVNRVRCVVDSLLLYAVGSKSNLTDGSGVLFSGCADSIVHNCVVQNHLGNGVCLYSSNYCWVTNNRFIASPATDGMLNNQVGADVAIIYGSSNNTIKDNQCISGNGTGVYVQAVVNGETVDSNLITNNIIRDCKAYGVIIYRNDDTYPSSQSVRGNIVSNNFISNTRGSIVNSFDSSLSFGAGIYLQGAEESVVSGNVIKRSHAGAGPFTELLAPGGIGVTNMTRASITGNVIDTCGMFGIDAGDPNSIGEPTGFLSVLGNTITSCTRGGIHIRRRGRVNIVGNTIDTTSDSGIEINNTALRPDILISDNQVRNTTGIGNIEVKFGEKVTITSNICDTSSTHGITIQDSNIGAIQGNIISGTSSRAVQIVSTCTGQLNVYNNTIVGTGTTSEGIRVDAAARLFNNSITACTTNYAGTFIPFKTLTVNSATPSVQDGTEFITNNSSATTISNFTSGYDGQVIRVVFTDANTTLDFTASNLKGNNGVDKVMTANDSISAVYRASVGAWYVTVNDA